MVKVYDILCSVLFITLILTLSFALFQIYWTKWRISCGITNFINTFFLFIFLFEENVSTSKWWFFKYYLNHHESKHILNTIDNLTSNSAMTTVISRVMLELYCNNSAFFNIFEKFCLDTCKGKVTLGKYLLFTEIITITNYYKHYL